MRLPSFHSEHPARQLMRRLDRAAGEVNAFLVVIAIGLALLNLCYLSALSIKNALPPITHVSCSLPASPAAGNAAGGPNP
jgi:hypothetical protein